MFLTDGGMETTLIFHDGIDLPCFAAFTLLKTRTARDRMRAYYARYAELAKRDGLGFVLESADLARQSATGRQSSAIRARRWPTPTARSIDLMAELRDQL